MNTNISGNIVGVYYPTDLVSFTKFMLAIKGKKQSCYIIVDNDGMRKLRSWFDAGFENSTNKRTSVFGFPILHIPSSDVNVCIVIESEETKDMIYHLKKIYNAYEKSQSPDNIPF